MKGHINHHAGLLGVPPLSCVLKAHCGTIENSKFPKRRIIFEITKTLPECIENFLLEENEKLPILNF